MHRTGIPESAGGVLYVVATPIGNRGDISVRAVETLRTADIIAAEDTRHSSRLLDELGIRNPTLLSLHEHNESDRVQSLLESLRAGRKVALVSDAGTPLVSDPGYRLIAAVHDAGLTVSPVPGACSVIAALSVSGLPSDRFYFEGFLPSTDAARRARLSVLASQRGTLVFLEAPHRILETLAACAEVLGGSRQATLARELTKTFETVRRDTLSGLRDFVAGDADQQRGEIVLLVEGAQERVAGSMMDERLLLETLAAEVPVARAAKMAARILGQPRRDIYRRLLELGYSADE